MYLKYLGPPLAVGLLLLALGVSQAAASRTTDIHISGKAVPSRADDKVARPHSPLNIPIRRFDLPKLPADRSKLLAAPPPRTGVPKQIGIARELADLQTPTGTAAALQWRPTASGSQVAALRIASQGASGIRIGLLIETMPAESKIRFHAPNSTSTAELTAGEALGIIAGNGFSDQGDKRGSTYWSPTVIGEELELELELPAGSSPDEVVISIPKISHLYSLASSQVAPLEARVASVGDAAPCNLDAVCHAETWGDTASAVAKMSYVDDGATYVCTGTLMSDGRMDGSYTPYFLTAHHCISSQASASTLETYWFYRSSSCGSASLNINYVHRWRGATLLYTNSIPDATLLLLRDDAPSGAWMAGSWALTPTYSDSATGIHHPKGDLQKISFGAVTSYNSCSNNGDGSFTCNSSSSATANHWGVRWSSGTTEGGSSGSGLWLTKDGQQFLIGTLHGSSNSGSCASTSGQSYYGSFKLAYEDGIKRWLQPEPEAVHTAVLQMPWFTKVPGYISRFALVNTGSSAANYKIEVKTEVGNFATLSESVSAGTIAAMSQQVIDVAALVQTLSTQPRASAVFKVDGAAAQLAGIYNLVQPNTGAIANSSLQLSKDFHTGSSELQSPWFTLAQGYRSEFIFSNIGSSDAAVTMTALPPSGTQAMHTDRRDFVVPANAQVLINAADLVSLGGSKESAAMFKVNGSEGNVKGVYKVVNMSTGTASSMEMLTPQADGDTTRLIAPWFSTAPGYSSRFVLTNRKWAPAKFGISIFTEPGNAASMISYGGTIPAHSQLILPAGAIVSRFSGATRGALAFDVAASPMDIEGMYQIQNDTTGAISNTALARAPTSATPQTVLTLPWFSAAPGYISRFVLVNRGYFDAAYKVDILPEPGNSVAQLHRSGMLKAGTMLVLPVSELVGDFSGLKRAAARIVVDGSAADIAGIYNIVSPETGAISNTLMSISPTVGQAFGPASPPLRATPESSGL